MTYILKASFVECFSKCCTSALCVDINTLCVDIVEHFDKCCTPAFRVDIVEHFGKWCTSAFHVSILILWKC